jgi:hypothetical protein
MLGPCRLRSSLTHLFSLTHRENGITCLLSSTHREHFFCPFVFNDSSGGTCIFNIFFRGLTVNLLPGMENKEAPPRIVQKHPPTDFQYFLLPGHGSFSLLPPERGPARVSVGQKSAQRPGCAENIGYPTSKRLSCQGLFEPTLPSLRRELAVNSGPLHSNLRVPANP